MLLLLLAGSIRRRCFWLQCRDGRYVDSTKAASLACQCLLATCAGIATHEVRAVRSSRPENGRRGHRHARRVRPRRGTCPGGRTESRPIMAFRLARPAHLIDINKVAELAGNRATGKFLSIGAVVRHAAFHRPIVDAPWDACSPRSCVTSRIIRSGWRGTFCGSIAHADPASEWCLVAATLGAEMVATSKRGKRSSPRMTFLKESCNGARGGRASDRGASTDRIQRHPLRLLRVQPPGWRLRHCGGAGDLSARRRCHGRAACRARRREARPRAYCEGRSRPAQSSAAARDIPGGGGGCRRCHRPDRGHPVGCRVPPAISCVPSPGGRWSRRPNERAHQGSGTTWVGRSIRRLEDPALVQGCGHFTADLAAAHWVRFVRSPVASGRIERIKSPPNASVFTGAICRA